MDRFFCYWLSLAAGFILIHESLFVLAFVPIIAVMVITRELKLLPIFLFALGALLASRDEYDKVLFRSDLGIPYAKSLHLEGVSVEQEEFRSKLRVLKVDAELLQKEIFLFVPGSYPVSSPFEGRGIIHPLSSYERPYFSQERNRTRSRTIGRLQILDPARDRTEKVAPEKELSWTQKFQNAIFKGEGDDLGRQVWKSFNRLGISHLLVVSGMHLAYVLGFLAFVGSAVLRRLRPGRHLWPLRAFFGLGLISLFLWFPEGVSIHRALAMGGLLLVAPVLWPKFQRYPWSERLSAVATLFLIINPDYYFRVGYWFSFFACYLLLRFCQRERSPWAWALTSVRVSLGIHLLAGILGLEMSIFSPILNLFYLSFFFCVLLPAQFLWWIFPHFLEELNRSFFEGSIQLDGCLQSYEPILYRSPWIFLVLMLGFLFLLRRRARNEVWTYGLGFILWGLVSQPIGLGGSSLQIQMLDVGQGDAFFIEMQDKRILIDGGEGERLWQFVQGGPGRRLDLWVLSHFDRDHAGAFQNLESRFSYDQLWIPRLDGSITSSQVKSKTKVRVSELQSGPMEVCSRDYCFSGWSQAARTSSLHRQVKNSDSIINYIYRRESRELVAIFLGDIGRLGERRLIRHLEAVRLSIPKSGLPLLKAGHHGSKTSTGPHLLENLKPQEVWLTSGRQNSYAFPHSSVLDRLISWGSTIRRLDATAGLKWNH
jgi:competence protein ComEC